MNTRNIGLALQHVVRQNFSSMRTVETRLSTCLAWIDQNYDKLLENVIKEDEVIKAKLE